MNRGRNSSIEFLRIWAMCFIICSHFCVHSGFDTANMEISLNKIILQVGVLGNLGVDIFIMISGYFLCETKFKLSRIVKIILQVFFYSILIYFVFVCCGITQFTIKSAIKACFPILFNGYWFATAYVILCIFSPYINIILHALGKREYLIYLGVMLFIWSVIPTFTTRTLYSNELCQFLLLYSLGAFVRKYPDMPFTIKHRYKLVIISAILLILTIVAPNFIDIHMPLLTNSYSRDSVLVILLAYGLLNLAVNAEMKISNAINSMASTTFGIYLIHDNSYIRQIIWSKLFHTQDYKYSPYLIAYMLICIMVIFVLCGLFDYFRQKLIEKPLMSVLDPILERITDAFEKKSSKIEQK